VFRPLDSKAWLADIIKKYDLSATGNGIKGVSGYKNSVRMQPHNRPHNY